MVLKSFLHEWEGGDEKRRQYLTTRKHTFAEKESCTRGVSVLVTFLV